MPKNRFFRHISGISAGKICFSKIRLRQILDIAILLQQCAKFHESSRNSRNTVFRQKSAVPVIFRKFRLQKSVLLTIEPCLKMSISGNLRHFQPEKSFSQKSDSVIFWALLICIFVQKIRKN